jgi:hypothetical protein
LSRCGRAAKGSEDEKSPAGQFHQISIDEFTLFVDVVFFGFRRPTIGGVAYGSGCRPRFA